MLTAGSGNFRRVGSYSAKIQKSGFFGLGNRASVAMRDSWASSNASEGKACAFEKRYVMFGLGLFYNSENYFAQT